MIEVVLIRLSHLAQHLATTKDVTLFKVEIDHCKAFRCVRFEYLLLLTPCGLVWLVSCSLTKIFTDLQLALAGHELRMI